MRWICQALSSDWLLRLQIEKKDKVIQWVKLAMPDVKPALLKELICPS
jgi:hypothetical protein